MMSGGANLILLPWVGFASSPFSFKTKQKSQAAFGF